MHTKPFILLLALSAFVGGIDTHAQKDASVHAVYVDNQGVMRWSDTDAEASFFGTNYTAPFAYAYRALKRKNADLHTAIDRDVYHMALLGLNAFRLHIWDVEITDSIGNLIDNEHLELLDYLVSQVEARGMAVMLTAQTNFGNGYPERNTDTGAYSYRFDKCDIHADTRAQEAQERYLTALMQHVNRYTGKMYGQDELIAGFEINNEPCHRGDAGATENYINRMYHAMRSAGCTRPIFYNVSHNADHRAAYYLTPVEGTTYQWYPSGLVANHSRRGNFLPAFDHYAIPFDTLPGFSTKARIIYEFDPADLSTSYQYPAVVRAFREAGFQWMTQFAYDPTDIAETNTEYQTHYMNLAYTPSKALSLAVAALTAQEDNRAKPMAEYPQDTVFGFTTVSYHRDLALYNSPTHYVYTNTHDVEPVSAKKLLRVAGAGSSPVVQYDGTGAYFLDKTASGVWRLEVMPDAVPIADAYEKPSPDRPVVEIVWTVHDMSITLPDLGTDFAVQAVTQGNPDARCHNGTIAVSPGVYLLRNAKAKGDSYTAQSPIGNRTIGEFVAPQAHKVPLRIVHDMPRVAAQGEPLTLQCIVTGEADSVLLRPDWVSFWRTDNPYIKFERQKGYTYSAQVPAEWLRGESFGYYITAYAPEQTVSMPGAEPVDPLAWNSRAATVYSVALSPAEAPVTLIADAADDKDIELYSLPTYEGAWSEVVRRMPKERDALRCRFEPRHGARNYLVRKYIGDIVGALRSQVSRTTHIVLCTAGGEGLDSVNVSLVTSEGITYTCRKALSESNITVPYEQLRQSPTAIVPIAYPDFTDCYFETSTPLPFDPADIEFIELSTGDIRQPAQLLLIGAFLE